jgi:K+-sensing histidine kinase KdpD
MIADEGEPVLPELREKVFEMGEIVNLKQHGVSQSGIGLAFCKLVVSEHSGNIYLTDYPPKGSAVVVEL